MRKLLLLSMIVIIAVPSLFAARKKDYAGKVTDYVYTDKKHNFSLTLDEEWKYKIQKNKSDFRFVLTKIKYAIPSGYTQAQDYTKIPKVVMYVVESSLSPRAFIDSLISPSYKTKVKKNILREFEILNMNQSSGFTPEKLVSRQKKTLKLDDRNGAYWTGQVKYTNEVAVSASSLGGKRVKGSYGGAIAAIKDGDKLVLFHIISEWNSFETVLEDALKIIKSIKWN